MAPPQNLIMAPGDPIRINMVHLCPEKLHRPITLVIF